MRFIVFFIGFAVSILIIKFRYNIQNFTGEFGFAERYLGAGGTNTFIVIMALLVFIGSLMYSLGTLDALVVNTVGRFF